MKDLKDIRKSINSIDQQILDLLAKRRNESLKVAETKKKVNTPIKDEKREEELLIDRISKAKDLGLDPHYVVRIFEEIISDSRNLQKEFFQDLINETPGKNVSVSFQGEAGAYSHIAADEFFSGLNVNFVGYQNFSKTLDSLEKGVVNYAILPIENNTSGGVNEVYDLLLQSRVSIIGEKNFNVKHCLLAKKESNLSKIKKVFCHPLAASQCSKYLNSLGAEIEYVSDTALSAKKLLDQDESYAAIASQEASKEYGLEILNNDVQNQKDSCTRFVILSRDPIKVDLKIPSKTSIVIATEKKPGALVDALIVFKELDVNLTKLESRPVLDNNWEEVFYLDFQGNLEEDKNISLIKQLKDKSKFLKILGCYPEDEAGGIVISKLINNSENK